MATSAFRSTTRRTSITGDSSTTTTANHRRSRSVSRFSHRAAVEEEHQQPSANRKGRFVNTVRGSGVPDISLDDLAIELFSSSDFCEKGRISEVSSVGDDRRRGRSVSRRGSRIGELRVSSEKNNNERVYEVTSRRRRSLSVAPSRINDSENEHFQRKINHTNAKDLSVRSKEKPSLQKPTVSNQQRGLRRCSSQKDFLRSHDGYSSYSSTLTDDEGNDARNNANGVGKALQAAYVQPKAMAENYDSVQSANSDVLKNVCTMRRSYRTQLEQSEKRKQELLAEIMLVEERGKELKKIVGEFRPTSKDITPTRRPTRGRKRSNDRNRMSKQLFDDVDKIIDDFISSVEETDISSFDGERSDTSSIIGGTMKPIMQYGDIESFKSPLRSDLLSTEMDGVVLPWLKWETSNDITPLLRSDIKQCPTTPENILQDVNEETTAGAYQERSVNSKSSHGSWSPGVANSFSLDIGEINKAGDNGNCKNNLLSLVPRKSHIDVDDYLKPPSNESILFEKWRYRERVNSGGLIICHSGSIGNWFF